MKARSVDTPRFFCETIPAVGGDALLDREESHHLAKVLRLQCGDPVDVIDGRGVLGRGSLLLVDAREAAVTIEERLEFPPSSRVTVAFGLPKGGALDFIVHRLTEIGVREIVPLVTDHSLAPKEWNEERWTRVLRETAKQCQETWVPVLRTPTPLADFLAGLGERAFTVCDEAERSVRAEVPQETILVGPEGGWSAAERERFRQQGAHRQGLGTNRLRAETAAVAAAILTKARLGEIP
jgi:16S rRNA (uracil1498-N3)-methyltransferase